MSYMTMSEMLHQYVIDTRNVKELRKLDYVMEVLLPYTKNKIEDLTAETDQFQPLQAPASPAIAQPNGIATPGTRKPRSDKGVKRGPYNCSTEPKRMCLGCRKYFKPNGDGTLHKHKCRPDYDSAADESYQY